MWCSPMPENSAPTWSASTPCSTTFRIVWACDSGPVIHVVGEVAEGIETEDDRELRKFGCRDSYWI